MPYLVSILISILLVELARRVLVGINFLSQAQEVKALLRSFYKAKSDDERQQLILSSAFKTLKMSLTILVWTVLFAAIIFAGLWFLGFDDTQYTSYFLSLSIFATFWSIVRYLLHRSTQQNAIQNSSGTLNHYNIIDRCLHWFALQPTLVRQLSFDLDRTYAVRSRSMSHTSCSTDGPVYVCGLARSGTTMLLRVLDEVEVFRSLSYRDMPFVLAPNLWNLLTRFSSKQAGSTERAHQDGIFVNYDSPEAFEEVFWRTFSANHSNQPGYSTAAPTPEVLERFADYRALVTHSKLNPAEIKKPLFRYLSKNNNNLLRLESLSADSTATILLVYRNPVDTARSLHRLHQQFCATYKHDRFSKAYMKWLGHHEFGPGHKPFNFAVSEMNPLLSPEDPNYWLDYWNAVYRHVLKRENLRCHFIEHEAMRANPAQMIREIYVTLGVVANYSAHAGLIKPEQSGSASLDEFDETILREAKKIQCALQASTKNIRC